MKRVLSSAVGDKIRVSEIPPDVRSDVHDDEELEPKAIFEKCFGRAFPVNSFDDDRVELGVGEVMGKPAYEHSNWLEPEFIEFVAKSKKPTNEIRNKRSKRGRVLK
jgi:hypothetical protein